MSANCDNGDVSNATPVMSFLYNQSEAAFKSAVVASPLRILAMSSVVTNLCSSLNSSSPALRGIR